MSLIKRFSERKKVFRERKITEKFMLIEGGDDCGLDSNEDEVVLKVEEVLLVDGVFDDAFGEGGDDDFIIGEGVVVSSSSFVKSIKSCLGGMMVSLIFLEGLEDEAMVEAIGVEAE
ncbi:hypothetical protein Tco_1327372 [Tanacetum coccineum]